MSATDFAGALSAARFAIGNAMGILYGPGAKAFADIALGNPNYLAQIAAMGEKNENGTLDSGDYAALGKMIGDVAVGVAVVAGAPISGLILGLWAVTGVAVLAYNNREHIEDFLNKLSESIDAGKPYLDGDPFTGMPWPGGKNPYTDDPNPLDGSRGGVGEATNGRFRDALNFFPSLDPLMLDLNGDGLELKRADGSVLFDHDGDGVRTGTGWIGSEDGILVRDVNGDGAITSGRELFGVDTVKSNGQKAANAFDALADLDSNSDGSFTAADIGWNQVKVWRDLDQDGVSDAGELFTLDQLGISRIGVVGSATNATGGSQAGTVVNGNLIAQSASFTRDGEDRAVSSVSLSAGAVDLGSNNFHREFTDHIPLTPAAIALPQMRGSGMVRDLSEAVSLDAEVAQALTDFALTPTREGQLALLDDLITEWAKSSTFWSSLEDSLGGTVEILGLPEGMTEQAYRKLVSVLEAFNGERFYRIADGARPATAGMTMIQGGGGGSGTVGGPKFTLRPPAAQLALLQQSYEALKDSIYGTLVTQTRLKPYLSSIEVTLTESGGIELSGGALAAKLESNRAVDARGALVDLIELNRYALVSAQ